jgi:hypothetical protein
MGMKRKIGVLIGVIVIAGILVSQAISQEAQPQGQPQAQPQPQVEPQKQQPPRIEGTRDPVQFRKRMADRLREGLDATDDQWKAIEPKLAKVQKLQMQQRRDILAGTNRRPPLPPPGGPEGTSELTIKTQELQKALDDKNSTPEAVKAALQAFREAREKSRKELADAQKELAGVCNERQQAFLVLSGILE